jgi:hypothetical protein
MQWLLGVACLFQHSQTGGTKLDLITQVMHCSICHQLCLLLLQFMTQRCCLASATAQCTRPIQSFCRSLLICWHQGTTYKVFNPVQHRNLGPLGQFARQVPDLFSTGSWRLGQAPVKAFQSLLVGSRTNSRGLPKLSVYRVAESPLTAKKSNPR